MYPSGFADNGAPALILNNAPTVVVSRSQSVPLQQNFNGTSMLVQCINCITGCSVILEASTAVSGQTLFIVSTSAGELQMSSDGGQLIDGESVYVVPPYSSVYLQWTGSIWNLVEQN